MRKTARIVLMLIVSVMFMAAITTNARPAEAANHWIRTDMKVEVGQTAYPNIYGLSYFGQQNGKEWFKYLYRWKSGKEYTYADFYFGCAVPPASVIEGGKVDLELNFKMVGLTGWTYHGTYSAPASEAYVTIADRKTLDANDEKYLWPGVKNANFLRSNVNATRTFTGYMPERHKLGDVIKIEFFCYAGKIAWFYKLAN